MQGIGAGDGDQKRIVTAMVKYVYFHLDTEEKYFKKFNYDLSNEHCTRHKEFREKVNELLKIIESNGKSQTIETLEFLMEWFYKHVMQEDKNYVECFKSNGLS